MNILDENIVDSQFNLLKGWRIPIRQIGRDFSRKGIKDDEIIPLLHSLNRPTFFTRDLGIYGRKLCHQRYCLVCMIVDKNEAAMFVRRLLKHPEFDTHVKRMGATLRISSKGIWVWRLHAKEEAFVEWP